jgi:hypothetical protein
VPMGVVGMEDHKVMDWRVTGRFGLFHCAAGEKKSNQHCSGEIYESLCSCSHRTILMSEAHRNRSVTLGYMVSSKGERVKEVD